MHGQCNGVIPYLPDTVPASLRPQVAELVADVGVFAKLHLVQDKESKKLIPFDALPMQERIFDAVRAGHNRIAVVKARQVAATTGAKMVLHWMAYTTAREAMHAIVSMRADSATALMDDNRRWLHDPPGLLQRPIDTHARGRIRYADTGASLQAFTSRSSTGLRSFQPAAALISEAAFAPDLEETIAQADAAVGDGLLICETTANNPGDYFSQLIAGAPENGWHVISLWWHEHPLYTDPPEMIPDDFVPTPAERQIQSAYGLTLGQLHWRRRRSATVGDVKFRREYPGCLDDCFLAREGGYYGEEVLQGITVVDHQVAERELEAPHPHDSYVMGVDVGGGVGGDYSTIAVVSVGTMQPVYCERSNTASPATWAHRVIQVATRYNRALVLAESNNHGHALILEMNNCGYRQQWRGAKGRPWVTSLQSKLDAFDSLREALTIIKVIDRTSWLELRALTIPVGKIAPEAPKGAHDDSAMAMALAYRCLRDVPSAARTLAAGSVPTRIDKLISRARAKRLRNHSLPF